MLVTVEAGPGLGIPVCTTVVKWLIYDIPVSGISVCTNCGIIADPWNSCVGNLCVYYCDIVADLWDSCVGVFCVHYCGVVAYLLDFCVEISVCTMLWLSG